VGYAGGTTPQPTYYVLGDHTETLQLDYDPAETSYDRLLEAFWSGHDPTRAAWSRQYKAAVFVHDAEQERLALESQRREAARHGSRMATEVLPATAFHLAEAYHQKYYLQQTPALMRVFSAVYPQSVAFIASAAASRVNGYVAGYGSLAELDAELAGFGLPLAAAETLRQIVQRRG